MSGSPKSTKGECPQEDTELDSLVRFQQRASIKSSRGVAEVASQSHKLKVGGSSPSPATSFLQRQK